MLSVHSLSAVSWSGPSLLLSAHTASLPSNLLFSNSVLPYTPIRLSTLNTLWGHSLLNTLWWEFVLTLGLFIVQADGNTSEDYQLFMSPLVQSEFTMRSYLNHWRCLAFHLYVFLKYYLWLRVLKLASAVWNLIPPFPRCVTQGKQHNLYQFSYL